MNEFVGTLLGTLTLSAPLILAAMAGLLSERSGIMDIGLEGKMLMSCIATVWSAQKTGNAWIGLAAGISAAVVLALGHWLLTQKYRMDHIISGMGINAIAFGASDFINQRFLDPNAQGFARIPMAALLALSLAIPFALSYLLNRHRIGLHLRATGEDPDKARAMGLRPQRIRLMSALWNGVFCGLAGTLLVTDVGSFAHEQTSGKGFIALAALIVGGWKPLPTLAACGFVGLLFQLRITFMGQPIFGTEVPSWVWVSLPFVVTVLALAGVFKRAKAPAGLGRS